MTRRARWWLLGLITAVAVAAAAIYGVGEWLRYQQQNTGPSSVEAEAESGPVPDERIVFRNTAFGAGYGHVSWVPIADPAGSRTITGQACDRVDATTKSTICLKINRGIGAAFEATLFDSTMKAERSWKLSGVPSRTRLSDDSSLVATTAFVTGHSYARADFSTETVIRKTGGASFGNLEKFALVMDGKRVTAADRNLWGVTFADDDTFFATAAFGGKTWLVRGDLPDRTLTVIRDGVECPSLSPDGTKIAYKKKVSVDGGTRWTIGVYSLADRSDTTLSEERSVDDQVEWLDDSTLLYGLPNAETVGDSDVWSIAADAAAQPELFIAHAWSPSVVRK